MFSEFGEFSVIEHIIKRTLHYNLSPIVCTTNAKEDIEIVNICKSLGVKFFVAHQLINYNDGEIAAGNIKLNFSTLLMQMIYFSVEKR